MATGRDIATEIEALHRERTEEAYLHAAGLKERSEQAAILQRRAFLADPDLARETRRMADESGDREEARRLAYRAEFLALLHLEHDAREASDRILTEEAAAVLPVDGEEITLRSAEVRIRNEGNRERRAAIEGARSQAIADLNGLRAERWSRHHEAAARLGYPGYAALCQALSGIDLAALRPLAERFLSETREMYAEFLSWLLKRRLGLKAGEARRHDLLRLFRAPEFDAAFPGTEMRPAAEGPLARMRIDARAGGRIAVDDEARPTKSPRAFVAPIEVPARIVLVYRPSGGRDDYHAFLHELGHALHFAYTDPGLPMEYRLLGDASVTEAFAFLMDGLMVERGWLRRFLRVGAPDDLLQLASFHRLYLVRRYFAKLEYEHLLHARGPLREMAEIYRELMARATLAEFPAELFLQDVDPHFYAARYLRAWIFEAQLRDLLRERFDEEWYRNDRTGPFLLELWRQGQRLPADELAKELGLGGLRIEPLLSRLSAHLH